MANDFSTASGTNLPIAAQEDVRCDGARGRGWTVLYIVLALAVPLAFVLITHNVWEDFLITFRHSRNLVEGNGLVFNQERAQRIQGFTSCLNVMLPAIFYAMSGRSEAAALNLYRAVCLAAYVAGGLLVMRMIVRDRGVDRLSPLVFVLLYVTEAKTVAYTMNGQESTLMAAFTVAGLAAAYWGLGKAWRLAALSWTGLLYTRPDAPVYIAAIALAGMIYRREQMRDVMRGIVKSGAVAAVLFLPWFVFVWVYYGQPIPQTLLAKSNFSMLDAVHPLTTVWAVLKDYPNGSSWPFLPVYYSFGGWPKVVDYYGLACGAICTVYWLIPSGDRLGRMASLIFTILALYLSFTNAFAILSAWYMPAAAVVGTVVLSRAIMQLSRIGRWLAVPARVFQVGIVGMSALLLVAQTNELRIQQREIEDNMRTRLGLYLHDVVAPGQKVYSEALGYIGYYSDRYILDWPGLVTPEVVRLRREKRVGFVTILNDLMPEWLVLRPAPEATAMEMPKLRDNYSVVQVFDASKGVQGHAFLFGRGYLFVDSTFYVLKRNDVTAATRTSAANPE